MRRLPLVHRLRVRTPCDVGWDAMDDLGRDRHCARCEMTVHDVASMTRAEVEALLEARERGERVCLHLHVRKSDGAVLVADGHVERAGRAPPSRLVAAAVATATVMTACSSAAPPPEAPLTVIAVAPANATAPEPLLAIENPPPPPVETPPPSPSSLPPSVTPETMPAPVRPRAVTAPKKIAAPPAKKPAPSKKRYVVLDGDAW